MTFRITGLSPEPFRPLYGLGDDALAARGARRIIADAKPGYPDRIELRDAEPGAAVLLVHYMHQPADTPFRASHAIFVREGAETTYDATDIVPEAIGRALISLRAFDADHMMVDADVVDGRALKPLITRFLDRADIAYLHAHYAGRGCYAARIERG